MTQTKKYYLQEVCTGLKKLGIVTKEDQVELIIKRGMSLSKESIEVLADCVRYNPTWLYGYLMDHAIRPAAFNYIIFLLKTNKPSLAVDISICGDAAGTGRR